MRRGSSPFSFDEAHLRLPRIARFRPMLAVLQLHEHHIRLAQTERRDERHLVVDDRDRAVLAGMGMVPNELHTDVILAHRRLPRRAVRAIENACPSVAGPTSV